MSKWQAAKHRQVQHTWRCLSCFFVSTRPSASVLFLCFVLLLPAVYRVWNTKTRKERTNQIMKTQRKQGNKANMFDMWSNMPPVCRAVSALSFLLADITLSSILLFLLFSLGFLHLITKDCQDICWLLSLLYAFLCVLSGVCFVSGMFVSAVLPDSFFMYPSFSIS